jgi:hypothetical protein
MLIHLPSVASFIDTSDALVYAAYQNGNVDHDSATSIADCSEVWFSLLSHRDAEIVEIVERYLQLNISFLVRGLAN